MRGGLLVEASSFVRGWVLRPPPAVVVPEIDESVAPDLAADPDAAPSPPAVVADIAPQPEITGPPEVAITIDGVPFWKGHANRLEHPEFKPKTPRQACGIWVALPTAERRPHVVTVTLWADGEQLAETDVDLSARYIGSIDEIAVDKLGVRVRGWVNDRARYLEPVQIEVRAGDAVLAQGTANLHREDLKQLLIGLGKHAYLLRIDALPAGVAPGDLRVFVVGTTVEVQRHEMALASQKQQTVAVAKPPPPAPSGKLRIVLDEIAGARATGEVVGICDRVTSRAISGWAVDVKSPNTPVVIDLTINNFVVASAITDRLRPDIAQKYKCDGFNGFDLELPPQFWLGKTLNVNVLSRKTGKPIERGTFTLRPHYRSALADTHGSEARLLAGLVREPQAREASPRGKPRAKPRGDTASVIVINRNGAELLERQLQSFSDFNTHPGTEILVVDHGSTDQSSQVVERWRRAGVNVRFLPRGRNFSFSSSNNFGAREAKPGDLLFVNNDIFFTEDALPSVLEALHQPGVGMVGLKLVDDRKADAEYTERAIQHLGVHYNTCQLDRVIHPVESRFGPQFEDVSRRDFLVPTVTGAFMAMTSEDFASVGGFCEAYFYGYEDVDLCMKVKFGLRKEIVLVGRTEAIHSRGYSRKQIGSWSGASMVRNRDTLAARFGLKMRRELRASVLDSFPYWTATRPVVAFAVTEAIATTAAGDFFTAYELAVELEEQLDVTVVFLEEQTTWYDVREVDILVVMTHNYELSKLKEPKQNLITIGWARNWFPAWSENFHTTFDLMFASSDRATKLLADTLGYPERVLRIATNPHRFHDVTEAPRHIDYAFTGNFWGHSRELIYMLDPNALPYSFAIYGTGWDKVPQLAKFARGLVAYDDLAKVYRQVRVVIDDANTVTKEWGAANSRIFDALSAGALVITNSPEVSEDAFAGALPSFTTRGELEALLERFCGDEPERLRVLQALQELVRTRHTYAHRAGDLIAALRQTIPTMLRISIKVPCPTERQAEQWGDYHLAKSLAKELRRLGHSVRLDFLNTWTSPDRLRDDVSICLRGLSIYQPVQDQINICWLISHPDIVSMGELKRYDRVYVASESFAAWLVGQGLDNVEVMLQCVDTDVFMPQPGVEKDLDVVFVGNSRAVFRPIVRDAIDAGVALKIVGAGWDGFVPADYVLTEHVANDRLARLYARARVVLNDHWDTMRENGFVSNRLYDCVAAGATVVSDAVPGISALFGPLVKEYHAPDELRPLIDAVMQSPPSGPAAEAIRKRVRSEHSVRSRAHVMSSYITGAYERLWRERAGLAAAATEPVAAPRAKLAALASASD